jgi:Zn-dependent protease
VNTLTTIATWLVPLVIAIVFHEVAHGWVARALGDPTAARLGRLTLNPIKHVDPIGTVVLPLMLALAHAPVFGWAKPVPVVASKLRNPRWHMMLVALAGPGSNLLLALASAAGLAIVAGGGMPEAGIERFVAQNLFNFLLINVFLAIFNLIPLPPFDGGHVVEGLLPRPLAAQWVKVGRFGFVLLIGLLLVLPALVPGADVVERLVSPIVRDVVTTLLGWVGFGG